MNKGEYYFNKFNKYVEQVANVGDEIEMHNLAGVVSTIKPEYFNDNYVKCNGIYDYKEEIDKRFDTKTTEYGSYHITVHVKDEAILLSVMYSLTIKSDCLKVYMSDTAREELGLKSTTTFFYLKDVLDVLDMIADLFEED